MKAKKLIMHTGMLPFVIGVVLGLIAKLADSREITSTFPIFADIFARFGIWIWVAALISIYSKKAVFAAIRSLVFFTGMLSAYYGYTILFLGFYPKSQIVLWSMIALFSPFCGFAIWYIRKKRWYANVFASLPLIIFFTEWYFTGKDNSLLFIIYLCMVLSFLVILPSNQKRLWSLLFGVLASVILILLIRVGVVVNIYDKLLNI